MSKHKFLQRFFGVFAFFSILLALLLVAGNILKPKWDGNVVAKNAIYKYRGGLDYLAIGTSDVICAVSPKMIFKETGYNGWNIAEPMQNIVMTYYALKHLMAETKIRPKYVFIGSENLLTAQGNSENLMHKFWDHKPINSVNLEMALDKESSHGRKGLLHSLFPVFDYHTKWKDLQNTPKDDGDFGFEGKWKIFKTKKKNINYYFSDENKTITLPDRNKLYMKKILDLAKKYNFKVVVLGIPNFSFYTKGKFLALARYAKEKQLDFIDLRTQQKSEYRLNYYKDFADAWHLGERGAKKMSKLVADYLKDQNTLVDKRNDKNYSEWK